MPRQRVQTNPSLKVVRSPNTQVQLRWCGALCRMVKALAHTLDAQRLLATCSRLIKSPVKDVQIASARLASVLLEGEGPTPPLPLGFGTGFCLSPAGYPGVTPTPSSTERVLGARLTALRPCAG